MLKAQLPTLLAEKEKEQEVRGVAVHDVRITVRCVSSNSETKNFLIVDTSLITDSRSDKEDSEQESHVESTTINTTGRKRKRIAGNVAVHDLRITETCACSYTGSNLTISNL